VRNTVEELYYDTKFVRVHELVVHEEKPDGMHELMPTECEDFGSSRFIETNLIEILKGIGKLRIHEPLEQDIKCNRYIMIVPWECKQDGAQQKLMAFLTHTWTGCRETDKWAIGKLFRNLPSE
jgi:hypothetical protein